MDILSLWRERDAMLVKTDQIPGHPA